MDEDSPPRTDEDPYDQLTRWIGSLPAPPCTSGEWLVSWWRPTPVNPSPDVRRRVFHTRLKADTFRGLLEDTHCGDCAIRATQVRIDYRPTGGWREVA
jgi:hypothetical protein